MCIVPLNKSNDTKSISKEKLLHSFNRAVFKSREKDVGRQVFFIQTIWEEVIRQASANGVSDDF